MNKFLSRKTCFLKLGLIAPLMALVACNELPQEAPDFCESEQRTISSEERKLSAFEYVVADGSYKQKLSHFFRFREQQLKLSNALDDRAVILAYLSEYPECCSVLKPWPIKDYPRFGDTDSFDDFLRETRDFNWTHDVVIENLDMVPSLIEMGINSSRINSSACGKSDFLMTG